MRLRVRFVERRADDNRVARGRDRVAEPVAAVSIAAHAVTRGQLSLLHERVDPQRIARTTIVHPYEHASVAYLQPSAQAATTSIGGLQAGVAQTSRQQHSAVVEAWAPGYRQRNRSPACPNTT